MKILAVDDEYLALKMLVGVVNELNPDDEIYPFTDASQALEFSKNTFCDVAFIDIKMREMTGLRLAKELKDIWNKINIIFVTGYDEYAECAMWMHASGYIMKPVTSEKIKRELSDLRYPVAPVDGALLKVQCFGNFEVFDMYGRNVNFSRQKSKELLAYLVYKNASSCSVKQIASVLFEDGEYDKKKRDYVQQIISSLNKTLKAIGAGDVINKHYNAISINKSFIDCDYFRFINGDVATINSYQGEFMSQYSWAEFAIGYLDNIFNKN